MTNASNTRDGFSGVVMGKTAGAALAGDAASAGRLAED